MSDFVICNGCERHVRSAESGCPFCGESVDATSRPSGDPSIRLSHRRRGIVAAAALGAAVTLGACGDDDAPADGGADVFEVSDVYGLPADVGIQFDGSPIDADVFEGADVYGLPPDSGE